MPEHRNAVAAALDPGDLNIDGIECGAVAFTGARARMSAARCYGSAGHHIKDPASPNKTRFEAGGIGKTLRELAGQSTSAATASARVTPASMAKLLQAAVQRLAGEGEERFEGVLRCMETNASISGMAMRVMREQNEDEGRAILLALFPRGQGGACAMAEGGSDSAGFCERAIEAVSSSLFSRRGDWRLPRRSSWVHLVPPRRLDPLVDIIFVHAVGCGEAGNAEPPYTVWGEFLPNFVQAHLAKVPGEVSDAEWVAKALGKSLASLVNDGRFCLLGHGLSGNLAYEIAKEMAINFALQPLHVFLSNSPHFESIDKAFEGLAPLEADCQAAHFARRNRLLFPLDVFYGDEVGVSVGNLSRWHQSTLGSVTLRPGLHRYQLFSRTPADDPSHLVHLVGESIARGLTRHPSYLFPS